MKIHTLCSKRMPLGQVVKTSPFHGVITGSKPVGVIFTIWRITQVRLKGSVLKTDRWLTPRGGSNPSSSLYHYRGVEQLAARRAHNPEVVGSSPTPQFIIVVYFISYK